MSVLVPSILGMSLAAEQAYALWSADLLESSTIDELFNVAFEPYREQKLFAYPSGGHLD